MKHIAVVGEGAWGTAVATLLAHNGHTVHLWCQDPAVAKAIQEKRVNIRYLPDIHLDNKIHPMTDLKEVICSAQWVFEAIPVKFLRSILQQTVTCFEKDQVWVVLSKGIEQKTLLLPTQIIDDVFDYKPHKAVFAGPSFALDVARKQITAVAVAATDCAQGAELQALLENNYFRAYLSTDLIGVQVGGAVKNVIALAIGILDGAGYTDNTKAFVLTRGLHELVTLTELLGGKRDTVYGLSGVGDVVLTALGRLSRNVAVGRLIGQGKTINTILKETGFIPEGVNTVQSLHQLMQKHNRILPICSGVYEIIYNGLSIRKFLEALMEEDLQQCYE